MDAFSDMVALKKVSSADVTHAISRKNWTSGTTYDSMTTLLVQLTPHQVQVQLTLRLYLYVITDEYNVYKCIRTGRRIMVQPLHQL